MRRTAPRLLAGLLLAATLGACGGGGEPAAQPSAPGSGAPSATPSPTPTLPTVAADKANAKKALVTTTDLGKPWFKPKTVSQVKRSTKTELCPGQDNSAARFEPRASDVVRFTEGKQAGAAIGSFSVRTFGFGQEAKWRAAFVAAAKACPKWNAAEGNFVTLELVKSPPTVAGADEVVAHVERIWADAKHTQLQYVRHYLEARAGRYVSTLEHAFVQPKSDPKGSDLAKTVSLLEKQVAKTAATFPA